jgi:competence protein ComEA
VHASSKAAVLVLAAMMLPPAGGSQRAASSPAPERGATVIPEDRVDLNHASLEQLLKVPGMTRTWAERIIRFRPYRSKQDLVEEGIVPGDVYKRIRDFVIAHRDKN